MECLVPHKQEIAVVDKGGVDLKVTTELYNTQSGCPLLPQSGLQMHSIIKHNLVIVSTALASCHVEVLLTFTSDQQHI